ncbi:hypothetical protein Tco_1341524, partial [Tanacetum coccineum]
MGRGTWYYSLGVSSIVDAFVRSELWEASVLLGRKKGGVRVAREDDRGVTEGREDVREVFQQRGSGAKRKLSRCGRNQMGNEPILALPEGADDFVVYYDARSKDLEACLEKGRRTSMVDFRGNWNTHFREMSFSLRWGLSFEYGCASFEAWYGKELLMPRVVKSRDKIFSRWGYCDNRGSS